MSMITKEQYLADPCRAASIPYWKAMSISIPEHMKILHDEDFRAQMLERYTDDPYFRLKHDLGDLKPVVIPEGFSLCAASPAEFAYHIGQCYDGIGVSEGELWSYTARAAYSPDLWLAVKDEQTGEIAATGIGELDREMGEGVLEWIQVSEGYRGRGLGRYIVSELLWRMKGTANFATVSGQCHAPTNPEALYRKCGFTGNDVWHILRERSQ